MIMAKIQELYDRATNKAIYPRTCTEAVYDSQGRDLETRLASVEKDTDDKLADYATATQLRDGLATKQDVLTVTDDLELTAGGVLSVAERAKREVFIDQWVAAGGIWNEATGYFELNGITDISWQEAMKIYSLYPLCQTGITVRTSMFTGLDVRTLFPMTILDWANCVAMFKFMSRVKVIVFDGRAVYGQTWARAFDGCENLEVIKGDILMQSATGAGGSGGMFTGCKALREVWLINLSDSISLYASAMLSYDSIDYMVSHAANTKPITITLHVDAFARCTPELLAKAEAKNITITTP